jgi:hypothetical protein
MGDMEPATSLAFARIARTLATEARRQGLSAPAFRSPPGLAGTDRTLRRRPDGGAVVSVRFRGRPVQAVVSDLVEGVVAANGLVGTSATRLRTALLEAVTTSGSTVGEGTWPNRQRQGA